MFEFKWEVGAYYSNIIRRYNHAYQIAYYDTCQDNGQEKIVYCLKEDGYPVTKLLFTTEDDFREGALREGDRIFYHNLGACEMCGEKRLLKLFRGRAFCTLCHFKFVIENTALKKSKPDHRKDTALFYEHKNKAEGFLKRLPIFDTLPDFFKKSDKCIFVKGLMMMTEREKKKYNYYPVYFYINLYDKEVYDVFFFSNQEESYYEVEVDYGISSNSESEWFFFADLATNVFINKNFGPDNFQTGEMEVITQFLERNKRSWSF